MGFLVSPGINITEIDLTLIVPGVATTTGALGGVFRWGPIGERLLIGDEPSLVQFYGQPTNLNPETFFTAASFLAYGSAMWVSRAGNTTTTNGALGVLTAFGNTGAVSNVLSLLVKNHNDYTTKYGAFDIGAQWIGRWPGALGNSLRLSACYDSNSFSSSLNLASFGTGANAFINVGSNTLTVSINAGSVSAANAAAETFITDIAVNDLVELGNTAIGLQFLKVTAVNYNPATATGNSTTGQANVTIGLNDIYKLHTNYSSTTSLLRFWEFYSLFKKAPGQSQWQLQFGNTAANDEAHFVVVDNGGLFTGTPGEVLEHYEALSRATDSQQLDGSTNYYANVITQDSQYVWWTNDNANGLSANGVNLVNPTTTAPISYTFTGGADGPGEANVAVSDVARAYDQFRSAEDVDVALIMTGKGIGGVDGSQLPNYICDNITEVRRDCVCFISPSYSDVVNNVGNELNSIITFRNQLRSTSYAFLDSGYKYMYDQYNDLYRWIPLNGDMAGLTALTEETHDAWWSPAGFNRGQIKNIVRLAWNPKQADRDVLYPAGINPVVQFPQQGFVLFGDKTLWAKPSAFDRINVRRLFIVLEKAISTMAKFFLFEFNDDFTRAQFRATVNPFLRDIKGRRGITDFLVVCDATNNTGQVIDQNRFVGDIYVKPNRSINFIQLNFIAVPTGVQFTEDLIGSNIPASAIIS